MEQTALPRLRTPSSGHSHTDAADPRGLADIELLAKWMDSAVEIPVLGVKVGLDAILGLIPGVGDATSFLVSLYIIDRARRLGVRRATIARMALNIAGDAIVGAVPIAGDLVDVFWKANQRNVALLRRHAAATRSEERKLRFADQAFVGIIVVLVAALAMASAVGTYVLIAWLLSTTGQLIG